MYKLNKNIFEFKGAYLYCLEEKVSLPVVVSPHPL